MGKEREFPMMGKKRQLPHYADADEGTLEQL
jgi:hypothetical protein